MEKQDEEMIQAIMALPEAKQNAIRWLISNYALAEGICKAEKLDHAERKAFREWAITHDDEIFLVLLELEKRIHPDE